MVEATPPKKLGPLAKRETKLAWILLSPTLLAVLIVVIIPLLSIFWISFKPIELSDLRAPKPIAKESLRGKPSKAGDVAALQYRLRNSSQEISIQNVELVDYIPDGLKLIGIDERCAYDKQFLKCQFGTFPAGYRETLKIEVIVSELYFINGIKPKDRRGMSPNMLIYIASPPTLGTKPLCALCMALSSRADRRENP